MEELTSEQRAHADAAFAQRLHVVHHAYVDIAGDLIAGALLGQIMYWFGTGKDGATRARIQKDGRAWIAKARGVAVLVWRNCVLVCVVVCVFVRMLLFSR